MPNKIKPRRSYTANSVPLTTDLEAHELAINWTDGKAYTKDAAGNIVSVTLGGGGGGSLSGSVTIPGLGDSQFAYVSLLLHGDGNLTDKSNSPKTVTANGSAAWSATQKKFGSHSLASLAAGDYYTVADHSSLAFGSGDWTIEMWLYPVAGNTGYRGIFGKRTDGSGNAPIMAFVDPDGVLNVYAANESTAVNWTVSLACSAAPSLNQWSHLAVVRSGTTITVWLNGVSVGSSSALGTSSLLANSAAFSIGSTAASGSSSYFGGYIDEVRITKGLGRFTSLFTPSSAAYADGADLTLPLTITGSGGGGGLSWSSVPASATATGTAGQIAYDGNGYVYLCVSQNTWVRTMFKVWPVDQYFSNVSVLLNMDGTGSAFDDLSLSPKTVTAVGNATQSTAQSKFGGRSAYFDGDGDYLTIPYSADMNISSGDWTVEAWVRASSLKNFQDIWRITTGGTDNQFAMCSVAADENGAIYLLTTNGNINWHYTTPTANGTLVANQWQHVAAVRSGSSVTLYVDGTSVLNYTYSGSLGATTGQTEIGANAGTGFGNARRFVGYIDSFRLSKGVARYSTNFTPPAVAFPNA